jgi:hypothetical protein
MPLNVEMDPKYIEVAQEQTFVPADGPFLLQHYGAFTGTPRICGNVSASDR